MNYSAVSTTDGPCAKRSSRGPSVVRVRDLVTTERITVSRDRLVVLRHTNLLTSHRARSASRENDV